MIKVDLTRKGEPLNEHLLRQYDVRGVPTGCFWTEVAGSGVICVW